MKIIKSENSNNAWRETLVTLMQSDIETDNDKCFRDEPVLIEISNPAPEEPDELFPMDAEDLKTVNHFITTGEKEDE